MAKDRFRNWWTRRLAQLGQWMLRRSSISRGGFVYLPATAGREATYVPQESVLLYLMTRLGAKDGMYEDDVRWTSGAIRLGLVNQSMVENWVLRAVRHR